MIGTQWKSVGIEKCHLKKLLKKKFWWIKMIIEKLTRWKRTQSEGKVFICKLDQWKQYIRSRILEYSLLSIQRNKKLVKTSNRGQFSYTKLDNSEKNGEK